MAKARQVYDAEFFRRIQAETGKYGNDMIKCVEDYANMRMNRSEFFLKMTDLSDKLEKTRSEEGDMIDYFKGIISQIQALQK